MAARRIIGTHEDDTLVRAHILANHNETLVRGHVVANHNETSSAVISPPTTTRRSFAD